MRRFALVVGVGLAALAAGTAVHSVDLGFLLAGLIAVLLAALAIGSMKGFLWGGIVFKPIIDIFYNRAIGSLTLQRVLAVVAPILGVLVLVRSGVDVLAFPMVIPLLTFALVNLLGIALSVDVIEGVQVFFRVVGPFVFYFAAARLLPDDAAVRRFIRAALLVLVIPYGIALLQLMGVLPTPVIELTYGLEGVRLFGPYRGPWDLARFLVVSVPFCLLEVAETDGTERAWWWAYLVANLVIAAFTNLKYAQIAVLMEVVLWFVLTKQYAKLTVVLAGVATLVTANFSFLSGLYADVTVLFTATDVASATGALSGRVGIWEWYLARYRAMPGVYRAFGSGFDFARIIGAGPGIGADPHNDILRVLVSNGWVGLVVYVWLLVAIGVFLARCVRRLRASGNGYRLKLAYASVCIYISYVAGSATANPSRYPSLAWYLWLLLGLLATTVMVQEKGVASE